MRDRDVYKIISEESKRQANTLNLIASENYVSSDVLEALGSVFTNKYAEGYPRARYYAGGKNVDDIEELAKSRAMKLFRLSKAKWSVNVQPYSGSPANLAVLSALIPIGEKIMGMSLDAGGHLTHGHKASITGKLWEQTRYGVDRISEEIDYGELLNRALIERPKCIIAGGSAYSRIIDFSRMRTIADEINALLFIDMSHFAGLVAGGFYPSPFKYADVVMTTTHKTLRGPRAGVIFSRKEFSAAIDRSVFPGIQGGPHINQIAAIAVALKEAAAPSFKSYAKHVVENAKILANELDALGWKIISGGTDTHLFLVDTMSRGISGKTASDLLEGVGVVVNKNMIPFDERNPGDPSGIRIGTPAITTRGMKEKEMKIIAGIIDKTLVKKSRRPEIESQVKELCGKFTMKN